MQLAAAPLMIYDGTCGFCRRWIARWQARTGDRVRYAPLQQPGLLRRLGIPLASALRAVQLVVDGERYQGADAVFRALGRAPGLRAVSRLARLPIVRWLTELAYRRIARHRVLAERIDRALFGRTTSPPDTRLVRWLYLRVLGGVYLIAFSSLRTQVLGLFGARGVRPIRDELDAARTLSAPRERLRLRPTVFWLDSSDRRLVAACTAGQIGGGLLLLGIAPRLTLSALWALYLSFVSVGRELLSFQWDALLLETGLQAILVAPPGLRPGIGRASTPWPAVLLMRWLASRLTLESGLTKLSSGDPTWRAGTACDYHFATQPLPTRLGWHAHQLPSAWHRLATRGVIAVELGAPLLAFAPRRVRRAGFWILTGLQGVIEATGNYGFFNLLAVANNLWLLDDEALSRVLSLDVPPRERAPWWRRAAIGLAAAPIAALSVSQLLARVDERLPMPEPLARLHVAAARFHVVNSYGLFAVMTTARREIILEGSDDGVTWREYRFRYKPDQPHEPPRFIAPHQPRLDWQMWFAALGRPPSWFRHLVARLLEGSPEVRALFASDPFPDHPPRYVRALLYDYRMTDRATRDRTGAWWKRDLLGLYLPPAQLARA